VRSIFLSTIDRRDEKSRVFYVKLNCKYNRTHTGTKEMRNMEAFNAWDVQSAVRSLPYPLIEDDSLLRSELRNPESPLRSTVKDLLPDSVGIPKIEADAVARAVAISLIQVLENSSEMELCITNEAVRRMIFGRLLDVVGEETALEAMQLYTDEAYHALFSKHLIERVSCAFDVPSPPPDSQLSRCLIELISSAPAELSDILWFMAAMCVETQVVRSLINHVGRNSNSHEGRPIQGLLNDHLRDELTHTRFFLRTFERLWAGLEPEAKISIGVRLPEIILEVNKPNSTRLSEIYMALPIDAEAARAKISELVSQENHKKIARVYSSTMLVALGRNGLFDFPEIAESFLSHGVIERRQVR
jgi:hypothetical protein